MLGGVAVCEAQQVRGRGRDAGFERVGAAVEDFVYGVDYVVDETLIFFSSCSSLVVEVCLQLEARRSAP